MHGLLPAFALLLSAIVANVQATDNLASCAADGRMYVATPAAITFSNQPDSSSGTTVSSYTKFGVTVTGSSPEVIKLAPTFQAGGSKTSGSGSVANWGMYSTCAAAGISATLDLAGTVFQWPASLVSGTDYVAVGGTATVAPVTGHPQQLSIALTATNAGDCVSFSLLQVTLALESGVTEGVNVLCGGTYASTKTDVSTSVSVTATTAANTITQYNYATTTATRFSYGNGTTIQAGGGTTTITQSAPASTTTVTTTEHKTKTITDKGCKETHVVFPKACCPSGLGSQDSDRVFKRAPASTTYTSTSLTTTQTSTTTQTTSTVTPTQTTVITGSTTRAITYKGKTATHSVPASVTATVSASAEIVTATVTKTKTVSETQCAKKTITATCPKSTSKAAINKADLAILKGIKKASKGADVEFSCSNKKTNWTY